MSGEPEWQFSIANVEKQLFRKLFEEVYTLTDFSRYFKSKTWATRVQIDMLCNFLIHFLKPEQPQTRLWTILYQWNDQMKTMIKSWSTSTKTQGTVIYWYALKEVISETELRIFTGYRDFDDGHSIHFRCSCKECHKSAVFNLRFMTFTRLNPHTDNCYAPKYRSKLTQSVPKSKRRSHKKTI